MTILLAIVVLAVWAVVLALLWAIFRPLFRVVRSADAQVEDYCPPGTYGPACAACPLRADCWNRSLT